VELRLTGADGQRLAGDVYWLPPRGIDDDAGCYEPLNEMPRVRPEVTWDFEPGPRETAITVRVVNGPEGVALLTRLRVIPEGEADEDLQPVYWDDNHFGLAPGEEREVRARVANDTLKGRAFRIAVDGWNVEGSRRQ
jgi:hypothetical protein